MVASLASVTYFVSDCQLFGRFAWETLLPRTFILLPMLIMITVKLIPANVLDRCRKQSEGMWKEGKPKKWYFAVPILIIWLMIIALVLKVLF